ncbi:proteasome assembly chaperone family protein [Halocalculus aciditolerans]|uniref:3-isopropylmalate dehydratase n=1 Tax=Halocalculus aciditolerans TaxID=1383812 RepID=A0A830FKR9_9EURY|nr:proteasome assembly chaperone family protein [Halocalculus aciditolerans]GGL61997.1 3-isopropylmalate dehydratase [Halocalculus aciditolerans]
MANVRVRNELDLDDPTLIEGLPGVGLVGKIATDHIVDQFDMTLVASVDCDGLPEVAVYREGETDVYPPVRIYGSEEHDVLALQSDVPVSRTAADDFATAVTDWLDEYGATPLYLSGLPHQAEDPGHVPEVFGVSTGDARHLLEKADVDLPPEEGVIGGPTGALVHQASLTDHDSVGLVVQADPQFPDPAASKQLIDNGIEPITDLTVDTDELVESAEEIQEQKQKLAQRMQQAAEEESSQAQPLRMFE